MLNPNLTLEQIITQKRKLMNETKTIINKLRNHAPVLSTVVDYGGNAKIDQLLHVQPEDAQPMIRNNFDKILLEAHNHDSADELRNKQSISFIDYKAEPAKTREAQRKHKRNRKTMKTSIVVEMPEQLKQLKNEILSLPSVHQSRMTFEKQNNLSTVGSRLVDSIQNSRSRRYYTQISESRPSNRFTEYKRNYLKSLNHILQQFDSPAIRCNSYIMNRHNACRRIMQEQQQLIKQYKRFENLGNPPKKIIHLKNLLRTFEKAVEGNMDAELAYQITHMDNKRYDVVLRHEEEARKLNMVRFQEKKKRQRIEQSKNGINDSSLPDNLGFKLNSKGKQVYNNRNKIVK